MPFFPWILGLLGNVVAFFGIQLTKKTAFIAITIAASVALTVALYSAITNLFLSLVYALPSTLSVAAMFLPSNLSACLTAIFTAKFARFVYDWNMKNLQMSASIN